MLSQSFFNFEQELSARLTHASLGLTCPFSPMIRNHKKYGETENHGSSMENVNVFCEKSQAVDSFYKDLLENI
jgi:hypothetical protein